ncbi:MAG: nuclear transport factor 2 family protein [Actinobacteria bacterium]|nr:nuclear transport factor 2 family protein [Actinomycetota bacterium]
MSEAETIDSAADNAAEEATVARIHADWWAANEGLDAVGMTEALAPDFLMWNLNGHPYYSRDELSTLLEYYAEHLVPEAPTELWDVRVVVSGELAYVTAEGMLPFLVATEEGGGASVVASMGPHYEERDGLIRFLFRETMVLRRDPDSPDGWSVCHFHCSPLAPRDEPRPGFGDTGASRAAAA